MSKYVITDLTKFKKDQFCIAMLSNDNECIRPMPYLSEKDIVDFSISTKKIYEFEGKYSSDRKSPHPNHPVWVL